MSKMESKLLVAIEPVTTVSLTLQVEYLKIFKTFTDWLLYTSVFAALCAVALCLATERLILNAIPETLTPLHSFIFGCTLVVYNAHFLLRKAEPKLSDRYRWTVQHRSWHYIVFFTGLIISGISIFFLNWQILIACLILGALSFTYRMARSLCRGP